MLVAIMIVCHTSQHPAGTPRIYGWEGQMCQLCVGVATYVFPVYNM